MKRQRIAASPRTAQSIRRPAHQKGLVAVPERKKVYPVPGQPGVDADVIPIKNSKEEWSTYTLEDDTVIRVKMVVAEVSRLINRYDNEGNPIYLTRGAPLQVVSSPEKLRKKP